MSLRKTHPHLTSKGPWEVSPGRSKVPGGLETPLIQRDIWHPTKLGKMCLVIIPIGHDSGGRCDQFLAKTWFQIGFSKIIVPPLPENQHDNIHHLKMYFPLNMAIFQCHSLEFSGGCTSRGHFCWGIFRQSMSLLLRDGSLAFRMYILGPA